MAIRAEMLVADPDLEVTHSQECRCGRKKSWRRVALPPERKGLHVQGLHCVPWWLDACRGQWSSTTRPAIRNYETVSCRAHPSRGLRDL